MVTVRDRFKFLLFHLQEIALDACTPGQEAMDRTMRHAKISFEYIKDWAEDATFNVNELMQEVWKDDPKADERYKAREKKAKGRKSRLQNHT